MPNSATKNRFPQEPKVDQDTDMDDFDLGSLEELAGFMVEALTVPLPADVRNSDGSDIGKISKTAPQPGKRLN